MCVSGLGSWSVGLVTPALDLSFGSWACGPASFLNGNYVCSWTWKQGHWTCHLSIGLVFWKLGLQPSFILNKKSCLCTWKLGRWTCHSSIGLVALKLGLRPSFILNKKWCVFLELDFGTSRLLLRHWTCYFEAGPFSFILKKKLCVFLDLEAGMLDLSSSIGLVFWKLGLRPSFILNKKLYVFLDLEAGTLDLSLQHWTCHIEAGPSAQLHS